MLPDRLLLEAESLLAACRAKGVRLAMAESCTGGLIAAALTAIAGSSDVVDRGFVTYSNESKHDLLGRSDRSDRATRRGQRRRGPRDGGRGFGPLPRDNRGGGDRGVGPRRRHRGQAGGAGLFRPGAAGAADHNFPTRVSGRPLGCSHRHGGTCVRPDPELSVADVVRSDRQALGPCEGTLRVARTGPMIAHSIVPTARLPSLPSLNRP